MRRSGTKDLRTAGIILAASLLFTVPAFLQPAVTYLHDFNAHVLFLRYFFDAFRDGHVYPRWLSGMYAGCGDATFFFYPPLVFFLAVPFMLLGAGAALALKLLMVPLTWLGGMAMYRYLREYVAPGPALHGALFYIFFLNRGASYYAIGSVSEYTGYMLLPAALLALRGLLQGRPGAAPALAAALGAVALSSLTVFLISMLFLPFYAVHEALEIPQFRRHAARTARSLLAIGALLLPLVAPVAVPFFRERAYVAAVQPDVLRHFLLVFQPFWMLPLLFTFCCAYVLVLHLRSFPETRRLAMFPAALMLVLFFLFTPGSFWLWQHIPPLRLLQNPLRLAGLMTLPMTLLFTLFLSRAGAGSVCSIWGINLLFLLMFMAFSMTASSRYAYMENYSIRAYHEFLPRAVDAARWSPEAAGDAAEQCREQVRVVKGTGNAEVRVWTPYRSDITVNASRETILRLGRFYYSYWRITEGRGGLAADPATGQILLTVPPGNQTLRLEFVHPFYIAATNAAGGCAWVALLIVLGGRRWRPGRSRQPKIDNLLLKR